MYQYEKPETGNDFQAAGKSGKKITEIYKTKPEKYIDNLTSILKMQRIIVNDQKAGLELFMNSLDYEGVERPNGNKHMYTFLESWAQMKLIKDVILKMSPPLVNTAYAGYESIKGMVLAFDKSEKVYRQLSAKNFSRDLNAKFINSFADLTLSIDEALLDFNLIAVKQEYTQLADSDKTTLYNESVNGLNQLQSKMGNNFRADFLRDIGALYFSGTQRTVRSGYPSVYTKSYLEIDVTLDGSSNSFYAMNDKAKLSAPNAAEYAKLLLSQYKGRFDPTLFAVPRKIRLFKEKDKEYDGLVYTNKYLVAYAWIDEKYNITVTRMPGFRNKEDNNYVSKFRNDISQELPSVSKIDTTE
jgi:hypothetical protein